MTKQTKKIQTANCPEFPKYVSWELIGEFTAWIFFVCFVYFVCFVIFSFYL